MERTEIEEGGGEVNEEVGRRRCGIENEDPPTGSGGKNISYLDSPRM